MRQRLACALWIVGSAVAGWAGQPGQHPSNQTATASKGMIAGPQTANAFALGQPLVPGTAVFTGEKFDTGPRGQAMLGSDGGGVLTLGHSSTATVSATSGRASLDLQKGFVICYGSSPVVTPGGFKEFAKPGSSFELMTDGSKTYVLDLHGDTNIATGTTPLNLTSGQAVLLERGPGGAIQVTPLSPHQFDQAVKPFALSGSPNFDKQDASPIR